MTDSLLMAAIMFVLWVAICIIAWRNSPNMRSVFPGGEVGVFWALLLETMPFLWLAPTTNASAAFASAVLGLPSPAGYFVAGGVMAAVWLSLIAVVPPTRRLWLNHVRLYHAQMVGQDLARAARDLPGRRA